MTTTVLVVNLGPKAVVVTSGGSPATVQVLHAQESRNVVIHQGASLTVVERPPQEARL